MVVIDIAVLHRHQSRSPSYYSKQVRPYDLDHGEVHSAGNYRSGKVDRNTGVRDSKGVRSQKNIALLAEEGKVGRHIPRLQHPQSHFLVHSLEGKVHHIRDLGRQSLEVELGHNPCPDLLGQVLEKVMRRIPSRSH